MTDKKVVKIRIERIQPAHIVDCWRLYEQEMRASKRAYPSFEEETPEALRSNLFHQMTLPSFLGVIAKAGRRPVGILLGWVQERPVGLPRRVVQVPTLWVDPDFRRMGVFKAMKNELSGVAKAGGIHHWESLVEPGTSELMTKIANGTVASHRLSGKISLE